MKRALALVRLRVSLSSCFWFAMHAILDCSFISLYSILSEKSFTVDTVTVSLVARIVFALSWFVRDLGELFSVESKNSFVGTSEKDTNDISLESSKFSIVWWISSSVVSRWSCSLRCKYAIFMIFTKKFQTCGGDNSNLIHCWRWIWQHAKSLWSGWM